MTLACTYFTFSTFVVIAFCQGTSICSRVFGLGIGVFALSSELCSLYRFVLRTHPHKVFIVKRYLQHNPTH